MSDVEKCGKCKKGIPLNEPIFEVMMYCREVQPFSRRRKWCGLVLCESCKTDDWAKFCGWGLEVKEPFVDDAI